MHSVTSNAVNNYVANSISPYKNIYPLSENDGLYTEIENSYLNAANYATFSGNTSLGQEGMWIGFKRSYGYAVLLLLIQDHIIIGNRNYNKSPKWSFNFII